MAESIPEILKPITLNVGDVFTLDVPKYHGWLGWFLTEISKNPKVRTEFKVIAAKESED